MSNPLNPLSGSQTNAFEMPPLETPPPSPPPSTVEGVAQLVLDGPPPLESPPRKRKVEIVPTTISDKKVKIEGSEIVFQHVQQMPIDNETQLINDIQTANKEDLSDKLPDYLKRVHFLKSLSGLDLILKKVVVLKVPLYAKEECRNALAKIFSLNDFRKLQAASATGGVIKISPSVFKCFIENKYNFRGKKASDWLLVQKTGVSIYHFFLNFLHGMIQFENTSQEALLLYIAAIEFDFDLEFLPDNINPKNSQFMTELAVAIALCQAHGTVFPEAYLEKRLGYFQGDGFTGLNILKAFEMLKNLQIKEMPTLLFETPIILNSFVAPVLREEVYVIEIEKRNLHFFELALRVILLQNVKDLPKLNTLMSAPEVESILRLNFKPLPLLSMLWHISDFQNFKIEYEDLKTNQKKSFEVNLSVLAANSPVFKQLQAEHKSTICFKSSEGFSSEAIHYMATHCYGGRILPQPLNVVYESYELAQKFEMDSFKEKCRMHLSSMSNMKNFDEIIKFGETHSDFTLISYVLKSIFWTINNTYFNSKEGVSVPSDNENQKIIKEFSTYGQHVTSLKLQESLQPLQSLKPLQSFFSDRAIAFICQHFKQLTSLEVQLNTVSREGFQQLSQTMQNLNALKIRGVPIKAHFDSILQIQNLSRLVMDYSHEIANEFLSLANHKGLKEIACFHKKGFKEGAQTLLKETFNKKNSEITLHFHPLG